MKIAVPISQTAAFLASAESLGRRHSGAGRSPPTPGAGSFGWPTTSRPRRRAKLVRDGIEALRRESEAAEGSLVVEAAPVAVKRHLDAWGKPGEAFAVMRRLKAEFDPRGFMNPGRFLGGI